MKYSLMHKKIPVLELEIDEETSNILSIGDVFAPERIPIGVQVDNFKPNRASLNRWWLGRAIPASRLGLRDALELMNVSSTGLLLLKCFGLSLSDQYWVDSHEKHLNWDEVNFFENSFSEDVGNALFGHASGSKKISLESPDNTSDGWLKKKWIVSGKRRLLVKGGSELISSLCVLSVSCKRRLLVKGGSEPAYQEPLNEVLASSILKRLGIHHANYELAWDGERPLSICEDFITKKTELISAWSIYKSGTKKRNISDYSYFLQRCEELGIPLIREGIERMLVLDYIVVNTDRHYNNFGMVRDADTLQWLGFAPIFDSGTSMWHNQFANRINGLMDQKSKPFNTKHSSQIKHVTDFSWLDFQALKGIDDEYSELLAQSVFIDDARRSALCLALNQRIQMLANIVARRRKS
ncbi:MAG: HipA domain-containing protein [Coriobacteriales bacterium]|jgi:hypothetical protein|nr:HipA domain-containing protein [Coriobacteriales bacterium]